MALKWNRDFEERNAYPTPRETIGLAQRARHHGMTIETVATGARVDHFVFDPRDGSRTYVTAVSCGCRQFVGSGCACQHVALLQVEKGFIPEAVREPVMKTESVR